MGGFSFRVALQETGTHLWKPPTEYSSVLGFAATPIYKLHTRAAHHRKQFGILEDISAGCSVEAAHFIFKWLVEHFVFLSSRPCTIKITTALVNMNDHKLDQDNYHQYASPDSTLSSGYGEYYGGFHHEETLPEVRADNSPQALSNTEAQLNRRFFEDQEPKYPVILDDAPKVFHSDDSFTSGSPTIITANPAPETKEKRIFGVRRGIFFSILVALVVIIVIAVGGGIGGAMASKSRSKASTGSAQALSTSSAASSR